TLKSGAASWPSFVSSVSFDALKPSERFELTAGFTPFVFADRMKLPKLLIALFRPAVSSTPSAITLELVASRRGIEPAERPGMPLVVEAATTSHTSRASEPPFAAASGARSIVPKSSVRPPSGVVSESIISLKLKPRYLTKEAEPLGLKTDNQTPLPPLP